jgi:hypothetical protein
MNALTTRFWRCSVNATFDSQDNMNMNMEVEHEQRIFIAADANMNNAVAALLAHNSMIMLMKETPGMP